MGLLPGRLRVPATGVLSLGLLLLAIGGRGSAPQDTVAGRTLRIGTDATYPPFESVQDGELRGFDIELGNLLGEELGAKVKWVNTSFDGIFPALHSGRFDLVLSAVTITPERLRRFDFSSPYAVAGQIVAVRQDTPEVTGLESLDGKVVGIQLNTTAALVLRRYPGIQVKQYPSMDLALQDLVNGNLTAVVGDAPTVRYFITHGFSRLRTVGELLTEERYGIAMRKGSELREPLNAALARLRASGRLAELEAKYFGAAARAEEGTARHALPWGRILRTLVRGLLLTLELTALALLAAVPLGLVVTLGRLARWRPLRGVSRVYVELLRGTPLLVQVIFIYYALPELLGLELAPFAAAVLALSLNSSAYVAEIFRAGIRAVDPGQMEAARALGMTGAQGMRTVVLPQALRHALPPLTNEAIALLKDSSLVSIIGMAELTRSGQELAGQLALPLVVWPLVALFYLLVTFPLTGLAGALEHRLRLHR